MAATLILDVAAFRALYGTAFPNPPYTDDMLNAYFVAAQCWITTTAECGPLSGACGQQALYLMMAHLMTLASQAASGDSPGQVQSSTVDRVSVTMVVPPIPNQWQFWMGTTPYGMQLLALLQAASAGGFYVGGLPEISAFRKVGGFY